MSRPRDRSRAAFDYLRRAGYDMVAVRADRAPVAGLKSYRALAEIPARVDLVVVDRLETAADDIVPAAKSRGADAVWVARRRPG